MKLTRRQKTFGAAAAAGLAGAVALAFAVPALAGGTDFIEINPGNVPTTAEDFKSQSCDQIPADTADWLDGWVFVLPNSVNAEGNFISITATFDDADGDEHVFTTDHDGGIVSGSGNNKAYIITPAGWTLTAAKAEINRDGDGKDFFNLTHACPATEEPPGEETPSEEPSTEVPTTEEPSTEAPTTEEPSTEVPTTEEPSSEVPTTDEPSSEVPTTDEPSSEAPTTDEPSSEVPTTDEPSSEAPTTDEPSSESPTTDEPSSEAPTSESPAESSSEPAATSSAPGGASTTPVSQLPTTGSSLTYFLVGGGIVILAGIVILVVLRRKSEPDAD